MAENNLDKYYENYAGLSVDEYVKKYIYANPEEMARINSTVSIVPDDVETVLDVGAGHSVFLETLEMNRGIRGVGIEITDSKVEYGQKKGIDIRKGSAERLDFPDDSFDMVVSTEVIEHLPYGIYESALKEMRRVAKKYIIISVPYDEDRVFTECPYCASIFSPSFHMRVFCDRDMQHLFDQAVLIFLDKLGELYKVPWIFKFLKKIKKNETPIFFNCPVCGFNNADTKAGETIRGGKNIHFSEWLKLVIKKLFFLKNPKWYLAVYKITG